VTDIVERLRGTRRVTQYDSAGRLITFEARSTDLEREAADEIEKARAALAAMIRFSETRVAEGLVDRAPELEPVRTYLQRT
jgi:hypothetical protein